MTRKDMQNVEETEEALENVRSAVESLKYLTDSSEVHYDFMAQIDQLRSEERRLEKELERAQGGAGDFTPDEEKMRKAVDEFAAMKGREFESAVEFLSENQDKVKNDLVPLYKVYLSGDEESSLPRDNEVAEKMTEYLKTNELSE